jgi:hypothetical protein
LIGRTLIQTYILNAKGLYGVFIGEGSVTNLEDNYLILLNLVSDMNYFVFFISDFNLLCCIKLLCIIIIEHIFNN